MRRSDPSASTACWCWGYQRLVIYDRSDRASCSVRDMCRDGWERGRAGLRWVLPRRRFARGSRGRRACHGSHYRRRWSRLGQRPAGPENFSQNSISKTIPLTSGFFCAPRRLLSGSSSPTARKPSCNSLPNMYRDWAHRKGVWKETPC